MVREEAGDIQALTSWLHYTLSARYDRVLAEPLPPALLRALPEPPR